MARRAIELKADCEDAYRVLGRALFESDRWKEAVELIDRALATSGDDYNVYLPYANALRSLGETEAATKLDEKLIAVLERQLEIVPEDTRARVLLANTYARANKISGAIAETEKAVATRPKDSLTLYNAACTYGVLNMKPEALATFKRAIEAGYRNPEWAARDNDLACLHNNPEFQRLIKEHQRRS